MRRVLVDAGRARRTAKRGGRLVRIALDEVDAATLDKWGAPEEIIALRQALDRLEATDVVICRIVKLKFLDGFEIEEIARKVGISRSTVKSRLKSGILWLRGHLEKPARGGQPTFPELRTIR